MLNHDNKDCEAWLRSKGSLIVEDQQFGPWLRTSQFSSAKQQSLEVKGYDGGESIPRPKSGQAMTGELQRFGSRVLP